MKMPVHILLERLGKAMSKIVKIQKPKFIEELIELNEINEYLKKEEKIQNKLIENITITTKVSKGFSIDSCIFRKVSFENCDLSKIDLIDSRFENCDLSNTSFQGGSIHRVEFIDCKLMGGRFDESSIRDVLFQNVLAKYSNFAFSKLKLVNIVNSDFQASIFQEVKKEKLSFKDTNLSNSYFNKTSLSNMDFTSCDITGIDTEIHNLQGAIVTAMQGLDLTRLMGLIIK